MASEAVDVKAVMAHKLDDVTVSYTERDAALYALTVGVAEDPADAEDLPLVFEMADFQTMPTFAVTFPFAGMAGLMGVKGLTFNPMMLLHGEQELHLNGPLPPSGTITSKMKIAGIYDKGKGALVHLDSRSYDESGREVCYQRSSVFIRGIGGFGGDRGAKAAAWDCPSGAPHATAAYKTQPNQALVYRLNGDTNPLHADPSMAAMGGFDKPILHGLCSFGVAARAILKKYCGNDTAKFKSIKARFSRHVFPGETIVTEMWTKGNTVWFQCSVSDRGSKEIVLSNGVATIEAGGAADAAAADTPADDCAAAPFFAQMKEAIEKDGAALVKKVKAVLVYKLTGPDSSWVVDLKNGSGSVTRGEPSGKADLTMTLKEADFLGLATGKLQPQAAFMQGKLKIKGNMGIAMRLGDVMKSMQPKAKM